MAGLQHGVVSIGQLRRAGIGDDAVRWRVEVGRLFRVHRGVYAVGHRGLSPEGHWMGAVLACGTGGVGPAGTVLATWGAALSHRSAAELWELLRPGDGRIHVMRRGDGGRRPRTGVRIHRSRALADADVTLRQGIPVTTPERTIADLPGMAPARLVRRATREAETRGLLRRSGTATDRTRSDLERDFLRFCRRHRLPRPEVNVKVGRWTVDFLWRSQRFVVETDSHAYHRGTIAFEDDHRRDLGLRRLGYAIHRYTGPQLREHSAQIAAELHEALGSSASDAGRAGRGIAPAS